MKGVHTYVFHLKPYRVHNRLIDWLVLRPIIWLVRQVFRLAGMILMQLISLLIQSFLFGAIFIIGISKAFYRCIVQRFPVVDVALPSVLLGSILVTLFTIIIMH